MKTVKIELTWIGTLAILIAGIEDGTAKGQELARLELARMARIADGMPAALKAMERAEEFMSGFEDDETQEGVKETLEMLRQERSFYDFGPSANDLLGDLVAGIRGLKQFGGMGGTEAEEILNAALEKAEEAAAS